VHLQLGSWRDRHRVTRRGGPAARRPLAYIAGSLLALVAACTAPDGAAAPHLTIHWTPDPAAGRDSVAEIQLNEAMARPVTGAHLQLEAFMAHPGMAPVTAAVEERGRGSYRARVRFTMAGDWVVRVQGTRPDGRPIDLQEDVRRVRPPE
jgi:YtkA-like protein